MLTRPSEVLNVFGPWVGFLLALVLLMRTQVWIHRHLFGIGYLATKEKGLATIAYLIFLLPGVLLREGSRFFVAGIVKVRPAFISPLPQVNDDGIVNVRFVHFLTLNPIFAALIALAPFLSGLAVIVLIGNQIGIPALIDTIGKVTYTTNGGTLFREALLKVMSRPDFIVFAYVMFGIVNTMLPTWHEFRATWFLWVIFAAFLGALAIIGLFYAIIRILNGPVAQVLWLLTAVFAVALVANLVSMVFILVIEGILGRLTNQKIQYQPVARPKATATLAPRSVYELRLPIPPPPGKILPLPAPVATSPKLAAGPDTAKPALPAPDIPAKPAIAAPETASKPGLPDPSKRLPVPAAPTPAAEKAPPLTPAPAAPSSPFGGPARQSGEVKSPAASTVPPPASPFGGPARQSGEVKSPAASTVPPPASSFGGPARQSGEVKSPAASTVPPASPFGGGKSEKETEKAGPPALTSGRQPIPASDKPFKPAPKTGVFDKPRAEAQSPANRGDQDYIDADVVDEPAPRPGLFSSPFGKKDKPDSASGNKKDGDDVQYVSSDEA